MATGVTATTFTVNGLVPGTTYYYTVKTVVGGLVSAASNEASAKASTMPPTNLTATAGVGTVSLSWSAAAGAASYNIYQGTASGSESATAVQTGVGETQVDITGLTAGTTYYFLVRAVTAGTISGASNEASAIPQSSSSPPPTPPAAPTDLSATAGVGKVSLSWSVVSGAASYNIYQGTASGSESPTAVKTGVSTTAVDVTGLTAGTTYYFVVKSVASGGVSKASNEASATPQAESTPTSPPAKSGGGGALGWPSLLWLTGVVASAVAMRRSGRRLELNGWEVSHGGPHL